MEQRALSTRNPMIQDRPQILRLRLSPLVDQLGPNGDCLNSTRLIDQSAGVTLCSVRQTWRGQLSELGCFCTKPAPVDGEGKATRYFCALVSSIRWLQYLISYNFVAVQISAKSRKQCAVATQRPSTDTQSTTCTQSNNGPSSRRAYDFAWALFAMS